MASEFWAYSCLLWCRLIPRDVVPAAINASEARSSESVLAPVAASGAVASPPPVAAGAAAGAAAVMFNLPKPKAPVGAAGWTVNGPGYFSWSAHGGRCTYLPFVLNIPGIPWSLKGHSAANWAAALWANTPNMSAMSTAVAVSNFGDMREGLPFGLVCLMFVIVPSHAEGAAADLISR